MTHTESPNTQPQAATDTRTPRQIAGAANGRLAAGAKSPEGRARSAANATKHGLTAKSRKFVNGPPPHAVLLNESTSAFDTLWQALSNCFLPNDAHELTLVRRMAEAEWLRQRAVLMESAALSEAMRQQAFAFHAHSDTQSIDSTDTESLRTWHAFSKLSSANPAFASLQRYAATHARAYARAERELRDYRISKAESIHPTPERLVESTTLEPNHEPVDRWQPLQAIEPGESAPETSAPETSAPETTTPATTTPETIQPLTDTPEIAFCETKLTPPPAAPRISHDTTIFDC